MNKKISVKDRIIPSAPFKNYLDIEDFAKLSKGSIKKIQIDACDGKFVKNISWPFSEKQLKDFEALGKKDDVDVYLPLWENFSYIVDIMCESPEKYIQSFAVYGVEEIIVHFRSISENREVWKDIVKDCKNFELGLYLAIDLQINLNDFLEFATNNLLNIEGFQVMGIERIGFQGQEFASASLELVRVLKVKFPDKKVLFDGGINMDTIESIRDAGVDVFCVGSYLTKANNFEENLQNIKSLLRE